MAEKQPITLLQRLLPVPVSAVAEQRLKTYLTVALWLGIAVSVLSTIVQPTLVTVSASATIVMINSILLVTVHRKQYFAARIITPLSIYLFIVYVGYNRYGIHSMAVQAFTIPIILAALFAGRTLMLLQTGRQTGYTESVFIF